jgi:hypothetical protein
MFAFRLSVGRANKMPSRDTSTLSVRRRNWLLSRKVRSLS